MRRAPPPRAALLFLPLFILHCASSASVTRRERPSARATHAALERATPLAERCLRAGDRVTVEGFFDGPTGRFRVERTGAADPATPDAVRQCVALHVEAARVHPFGAPRHAARWTVADAISPAVRAMLAADASVGGAPAVEGDIDARAVTRVMRAQVEEIRRCYEAALRGDPSLQGHLTLRLTISVDGRVIEATARQGARSLREVGHCALGHLRAVAFPRAREAAVDFEFNFAFAPGDAGVTRGSPASP